MEKGRSKRLIILRNDRLRERYNMYKEEKCMTEEEIIHILSCEEFFLSKERIKEILFQDEL